MSGSSGRSIGMETFGASAPLKELQKKFGFTPENIVDGSQGSRSRERGEPCESRWVPTMPDSS